MKKLIFYLFLIFVGCQNNFDSNKVICVNKFSTLIKLPHDKKFNYNDNWLITMGANTYQIMKVLTYKNCQLDSIVVVKSEGELEYDIKAIQMDSSLNNFYFDKKTKKIMIGSNSIIDDRDTLQITFKSNKNFIVVNKKNYYYLYTVSD